MFETSDHFCNQVEFPFGWIHKNILSYLSYFNIKVIDLLVLLLSLFNIVPHDSLFKIIVIV